MCIVQWRFPPGELPKFKKGDKREILMDGWMDGWIVCVLDVWKYNQKQEIQLNNDST